MNPIKRLRAELESRLQPSYLAFVAGAIVVLSLVMAVAMFLTSDEGKTAFGVNLGEDFSGFYVAAEILNRGQSQHLYDKALHHQLYHELLPHEDEKTSIPYVHPPFVAGFLKPLARLPYPTAVAIWLVISASLYVAGTMLLLRALAWPVEQRGLILILTWSFEPFAFECWLNGQLSAIGYCSYSLCFAAMQRSKSIWAGMALGLCFYKPTLLILMLPMLLIGRRWKILLGMTITGSVLVVLSILLVGWEVNVSYLGELFSFQKSTSGGDLEIRTWKYVDLNNCLRGLLGTGSPLQPLLLFGIGAVPLACLVRAWWVMGRCDDEFRRLLWASTMAWTPVLNLYVGIYDSILVVQSALITAAALIARNQSSPPLIGSGFAYLLVLLYVAPWFSQNLAAVTGIPIYTLLLICLGIFQLGLLSGMRKSTFPIATSSTPTNSNA